MTQFDPAGTNGIDLDNRWTKRYFDEDILPYLNITYASSLIVEDSKFETNGLSPMNNTATEFVGEVLRPKLLSDNPEEVEEAISKLLPVLYTAAFIGDQRFLKSLFSKALYSESTRNNDPINMEDNGRRDYYVNPFDTDPQYYALRQRVYSELQNLLPIDMGNEKKKCWVKDFEDFNQDIMFFYQNFQESVYYDIQGFDPGGSPLPEGNPSYVNMIPYEGVLFYEDRIDPLNGGYENMRNYDARVNSFGFEILKVMRKLIGDDKEPHRVSREDVWGDVDYAPTSRLWWNVKHILHNAMLSGVNPADVVCLTYYLDGGKFLRNFFISPDKTFALHRKLLDCIRPTEKMCDENGNINPNWSEEKDNEWFRKMGAISSWSEISDAYYDYVYLLARNCEDGEREGLIFQVLYEDLAQLGELVAEKNLNPKLLVNFIEMHEEIKEEMRRVYDHDM
jgi:hypothetical protein